MVAFWVVDDPLPWIGATDASDHLGLVSAWTRMDMGAGIGY